MVLYRRRTIRPFTMSLLLNKVSAPSALRDKWTSMFFRLWMRAPRTRTQ